MTVGFIGTGHIAAPMARSLARDGRQVVVSERSASVSGALAASFDTIEVADNQSVVDQAEIVILCIRPHLAHKIIAPLSFRADQKIVSVMAGITEAQLLEWIAPAQDLSITIPLGFLEQGGCPLAVYPNGDVLSDLFGARNPIFPVASEAALNAHFSICALVPGILSMLQTGAETLGEATGDMDAAERYTTQLTAGFLASMDHGAGQLEVEKSALATKGTISLMMVDALENGGANATLRATMKAIGQKLGAA